MIRTRTVSVEGLNVFVREGGETSSPAIVLLHGFPSSSHMFRDLLPQLAPNFHVIAPDFIGFGHSDAPPVGAFSYTFDRLAQVVDQVLERLGVARYALYLHDYGGPVGLRLAVAHPERVTGLIIQNSVAALDGIGPAVADTLMPLWKARTPETERAASTFVTPQMTKTQYTAGARDPAALNPDAWVFDQALLDRPGNVRLQLELFVDYQTNVAKYPEWSAYFRAHQPPTLIVWGKNDPLFTPAGAEAYRRDLPELELHYLDGGHFALEEHASTIAAHISRFFATRLGAQR